MRIRIAAAAPLILLTGCTQQIPSAQPILISKAPSIKIALACDHVPQCRVVMHNLSSRGVVAYVLSDGGDPETEIATTSELDGTPGHPAIPPGGDSHQGLFTSGQAARQGQIIVAAAIFTDGSYEGDFNVAAKLKARQIGALTVHRLIKPVIDHIVQDQSMNDEARTARIKDEIFHIPSRPEDTDTRSLQSQFPDLPTQVAIADLAGGLDAARNEIWGDLYGYMHKCCQYPPPDHISLEDWWRRRERNL
jgi:hypothetical protein